jgi:oligoendopeptidase F
MKAAIGFCWLLAAAGSVAAAPATQPAAHPATNPAYMWDLTDLYPSPAAWTAEYDRLAAASSGLARFKGTLGRSAGDLFAALDAISEVRKQLYRLSVYSTLKGDEDVKIAVNQERVQLAQNLMTTFGADTAWVTPEILAVDPQKIAAFQQESPELARRFDFLLRDTLRGRAHTLGAEAEGAMAGAGVLLNQPDNIYAQLATVELPFPTVTLSTGGKVRLDQSAYEQYRQSPNRADRKKVFDAFWATWGRYEGTFGATLTAQVLGEEFDAKVRHFPNALSDALFGYDMPEAVYRQLVAQANAGLPVFHRYLKLRKRLLGITDDLGYHDGYAPLFKLEKPVHFSIADAERIAFEVTAPYGPEYAALLHRAFSGRWMDVLPRPAKAPGAYMNGSAYDVHPYLLLNHNDDYLSLSTFVHEWGHAVHTLLTHANQPYEKSDYSTFTAETASIANEMLLNDYLVAHARDRTERLYYLGEGLELIRGTFFRQTMFGEFQLAIHEEVEKGGALSGKHISELYCGLLKKYHGDAQGVMKIDPAYCIEWAFIPHFYGGFYVYQYATSMAGAALLTDAIEKDGAPARDRYLAMLEAGASDYPYELYRKAGLDMATPQPYQALIARMSRILDEIEALQARPQSVAADPHVGQARRTALGSNAATTPSSGR